MNKVKMIQAIADATDLSKAAVTKVYDELVAQTQLALGRGEEVSLHGLGKFEVTRRAERQGRNPQTGKSITIAAQNVAKFKASKTLKDALN